MIIDYIYLDIEFYLNIYRGVKGKKKPPVLRGGLYPNCGGRGFLKDVTPVRLERTTNGLKGHCSTN